MDDVLGPLWLRLAVGQFHLFVLVLVRLSGLMILAPIFGQTVVPVMVRVLLCVGLSLLITPNLRQLSDRGFRELDTNQDGQLTDTEIPASVAGRLALTTTEQGPLAGRVDAEPITTVAYEDYVRQPGLPRTLIDLVATAAIELALGLVLGLGMTTILAALQIAGELIDTQTGFGYGSIIDPGLQGNETISSSNLLMLGTAIFVLLEPFGGHQVLLRTLIESFQTLPAGQAWLSPAVDQLLGHLVAQSFMLAIRLAVPLIVMMWLIDLTLNLLNRSAPQISLYAIGFLIKVLAGLLIIATALSAVPELLIETLGEAFQAMRFLVLEGH